MDGVGVLVRDARAAGLEVSVVAGRLVLRGPQDLRPVAEQLLGQQDAVLELLVSEAEHCSSKPAPAAGGGADELVSVIRASIDEPFVGADVRVPCRGGCGLPVYPGQTCTACTERAMAAWRAAHGWGNDPAHRPEAAVPSPTGLTSPRADPLARACVGVSTGPQAPVGAGGRDPRGGTTVRCTASDEETEAAGQAAGLAEGTACAPHPEAQKTGIGHAEGRT